MPTTRQQRRAKARKPSSGQRGRAATRAANRRKTQVWFVLGLAALLGVGGSLLSLTKKEPPKITRGAIINEHWHSNYSMEICGKRLTPFRSVEGEIHTHGDGKIHIHPHTAAFALNNATLGKFFESVEMEIGRRDGKDFMRLPDGKLFVDGGSCDGIAGAQQLVFLANGAPIAGDPSAYVLHNGDDIVVRYGPMVKGQAPTTTAAPEGAPGAGSAPAPLKTPQATPAPASPRR